jgi:hypothetical protein
MDAIIKKSHVSEEIAETTKDYASEFDLFYLS